MINSGNGARIKAWAGSGVGSGIVKNITFTNFVDSKVDLPITIDQCYSTTAAAVSVPIPTSLYSSLIFFPL
jgi:galacturan 1,4-alpha-galacturonidase